MISDGGSRYEIAVPGLRLTPPPGFRGLPIPGDPEARAEVTQQLVHGSRVAMAPPEVAAAAESVDQWAAHGIRLIGYHPLNAGERSSTVTVVLATTPIAPGLPRGSQLLDELSRNLVCRIEKLPLGPALVTIDDDDPGTIKVQFLIPLPDGDSMAVLTVGAAVVDHHGCDQREAVARSAGRLAAGLRIVDER